MPAERSSRQNLKQATLDGALVSVSPRTSPHKAGKAPSGKPSKPERLTTDAVISIKPEFARLISTREKNHEFRKYEISKGKAERLWLYESGPVSAIRYVMSTSKPKTQGQVNDSTGIGNDDFDAGKKESKFGYPVLGLWELKEPLKPEEMRQYGLSPPQSFCYVPKTLADARKLEDMEQLF
ncbi:hypothetical protein FISHEDRAFT_74606 [Fistulina hepatica ATCC 64428]|uniref:Uncharacterized protein n=1 Tax=Fistulina hepatica ATCC 64428 TaxID=1128425 RepID=A0A0D7A9K0_9AGAR|nr:hypothetical protein FISHEDRAFT_74606 [Fistulina hepatica ATCC 64428]